MKRALWHILLGGGLAALELVAAIHTVVLDVPYLFLGLLFLLFFLVSLLVLRRKENHPFFLLTFLTYALGVLGYYFLVLRTQRLPIVLLSVLYYCLFYIFPALLGILVYLLVRELFRPVPPRPVHAIRLEQELRIKTRKRKTAPAEPEEED
ncbi:MAG: hypothetical protein WCN99_05850 [bacterium]